MAQRWRFYMLLLGADFVWSQHITTTPSDSTVGHFAEGRAQTQDLLRAEIHLAFRWESRESPNPSAVGGHMEGGRGPPNAVNQSEAFTTVNSEPRNWWHVNTSEAVNHCWDSRVEPNAMLHYLCFKHQTLFTVYRCLQLIGPVSVTWSATIASLLRACTRAVSTTFSVSLIAASMYLSWAGAFYINKSKFLWKPVKTGIEVPTLPTSSNTDLRLLQVHFYGLISLLVPWLTSTHAFYSTLFLAV